MSEEIKIDNNLLKAFFQEISKYAEGVHKLKKGLNIHLLENFEEEYDVKLPWVYKSFLLSCNGGEIFIPGTVFAQVYNPVFGPKIRGESYLDETFRTEIRRKGMPDHFLIIADMNYGDSICIDLTSSNGKDAEVVQWDSTATSISRKWNGIIDWMMDALNEGAMLIDYDGNEKELDF